MIHNDQSTVVIHVPGVTNGHLSYYQEEIHAGTVNLVISLWLMRSWIREENILLPLS